MENNKILFGGMIIAVVLSLLGFLNSLDKDVSIIASVDDSQQNSITVSAEAERMVKPDTASVSFSLTRKSTVLATATKSVNDRMADLLNALDDQGIEEKDIKTTAYSVYPEYDWNDGNRRFNGYRVTQSLELKIRDLEEVEDVMSEISNMQVDNVSNLNFFVDDDEEIREELRGEAIAEAKEKAEKLAKELGVSLGEIISFSESNQNYYPQPLYSMRSDFIEESAGGVASIPTGEDELKASVSITYRLK